MDPLIIRDAREEDLRAVNAIYNHYVEHSTCTYQYEPTSPAERLAWFRERSDRHPVTIAALAGEIVAWGALSSFRARVGYRYTVENAVYVRQDLHRRGIGRRVLADLVERAAVLGHRSIIAAISAEQHGSISLHRELGFAQVGLIPQAAIKFDTWLDLLLMQRLVGVREANAE